MPDTRNKQTLNWMFGLMVWSFIFQAVGFLSPWWLNFRYCSVNYAFTGMWYTVLCINGEYRTIGISDYEENGLDKNGMVSSNMVQYQMETSLAILTCIVAMVAFKRYKDGLPQDNSTTQPSTDMVYLGLFACFVSGVLALTAVSSYGNKLIESKRLFRVLSNGSSESPIKFPYSLVITAIGVLFAAVVFVIALVRKPWQTQTNRGTTQGFVMSQPYQPTATYATANIYPPPYTVSNNYPTAYVVSTNDYPTKSGQINNA